MELELHQLELKYERLRIFDPGRQSRLMAAIAEQGQRSPVLVVEDGSNRYILIDGYRRVLAIQALGKDTVEALILPLNEVDALVFGRRQEFWQKRCALEDGWLVQELLTQQRLNMNEVAYQLGRSKSWVSRRLGLVQALPERVQELVRCGKICPYAAMKYLVPLARANESDCARLAEGIAGQRLGARQVQQLYIAWKLADREERQRIVTHPLLYLKASEELKKPDLQDPEEEQLQALLRDLESLTGVAYRLRRRVRDSRLILDEGMYRKRLAPVWQESRQAFESLEVVLEEKLHVGSGHTDCFATAAP